MTDGNAPHAASPPPKPADELLAELEPYRGKKLKLERDKKIALEPFNPHEVSHFLHTCQKHYPQHLPFFFCAFITFSVLSY